MTVPRAPLTVLWQEIVFLKDQKAGLTQSTAIFRTPVCQ